MGENYFMGLVAPVVFGFLVILGMRRFLPKTFKSNKFILEDICMWEDVLNLLRNSKIRRLLWITLGFLVIIKLGYYIPLPGLNHEAVASMLGKTSVIGGFSSALSFMSIFSLGIMPFLSANMLLLLFSIAIPRLRRFSQSSITSNQMMTRWAYLLTIIICLIQGYFTSGWLQSPGNWFEGTLVLSSGLNFTITSAVLMTLGTAAILLITSGINKLGIGHGISLIMIFAMCTRLANRILYSVHRSLVSKQDFTSAEDLVPGLFLIVVALSFGFWLLRIKRVVTVEDGSSGKKTPLRISINQSGLIPVVLASSLIMLPMMFIVKFSSSPSLNRYASVLSPGQPIYYVTHLVLVVLFSLAYGRIAFNPKYTAMRLRQNNLRIVGEENVENVENVLIRILVKLNFIWAGVLAIYFVLLNILCNIWHFPYIHAISLLVIPAVIIGCLQTILRRSNDLKEIYMHSEIGEILVAKSYLDTKGIKTYLDNTEAYGRLYCYFIGPLATKQLFVDSQDYLGALELMEEYKLRKL
jgi:preprotein translocase subunit SecY